MIIKRDELLVALKTIDPTVAKSGNVEILACYCFEFGTIRSHNGKSGTSVPFVYENNFCVNAQKFSKEIKDCHDELTLTVDNNKIVIKSGKYRSTLPILPTHTFPSIPDATDSFYDESDLSLCLWRVELPSLITTVNVQGVIFRDHFVYASDGYRLSRVRLANRIPASITLPNIAVDSFLKLPAIGGSYKTYYNQGNFIAKNEKITFYSSLLNVPNFTTVADNMLLGCQNDLHELPPEFADAVKRVAKNAPSGSKERAITIEAKNKIISLSSYVELSDSTDEVEWASDAEFKIKVDPVNLLQALKITNKINIDRVNSKTGACLRFHDDNFDHAISLFEC